MSTLILNSSHGEVVLAKRIITIDDLEIKLDLGQIVEPFLSS